MSHKELDRLGVVNQALAKGLSQRKAAELLGLSVRQTRRLMHAVQDVGPKGLQSKKRGRVSNRRLTAELQEQAIELIRERYEGFGPTFANEKLRELHGIKVADETLRKWMVTAGLWVPRAQRRRVFQRRNRRECLGELVQIDGSAHRWFEERGPKCTLLVYVDDATSRLMALRFVQSESTFDYFEATRDYITQHGKPVAWYSDKHSIFRVSQKPGKAIRSQTQFGRAMNQLNIEVICANTPQAKGRVERANRTLQDRLVKELRLRGISSMEAGNAFLPEFMADYNARFAKAPHNPHDAHRPLQLGEDLHEVLTCQVTRKISGDLMVHYNNRLYRITPNEETRRFTKKQCAVFEWEDGTVELRCEGTLLPYSTFEKDWVNKQTPVVPNKLLDDTIEWARTRQLERLKTEKLSDRITKRRRARIEEMVAD